MRIGIVAGEHSGDFLAAKLMVAIRQRKPDVVFEGIAGPRMVKAGCGALYAMDELAVMGLVEVLGRLGRLVSLRRALADYFIRKPPDLFIGVDAPDFNLGLEYRLKRAGIPTVHYVSPSVWAWRRYRVRKIKRSVDRVLALFPFEADFYHSHGIDVRYVGHPLAEQIPFQVNKLVARRELGVQEHGLFVALLPGSRASEVSRLAAPFIATAQWCRQRRPDLGFLASVTDAKTRDIFVSALEAQGVSVPVTVVEGNSHQVMGAADVVLVASGTATLEALLLKRPMVVAYRLAPLTYYLAKKLVKLPYYSLPNLLAGEPLVPEFIQDRLTPDILGAQVLDWLNSPDKTEALVIKFKQIHEQLLGSGSAIAAAAALEVVGH